MTKPPAAAHPSLTRRHMLAGLGSTCLIASPPGFAQAPAHWHAMATTGLLMSLIFAVIYFRLFPRLTVAVEESAWPAAAVALDGIRRLVVVNLGLGTLTLAIAAAGGLLAG